MLRTGGPVPGRLLDLRRVGWLAAAWLAAAPAGAASCRPGGWVEAGPPAVFRNDLYGALKTYVLRAKAGLALSTPSLAGFAVLADSEAAKIPGTLKNEGLVFDGREAIFSWRYGLQRTDARYRPLVTRPLAIPPDVQREHYDPARGNGFGHIGDIDLAGGRLYVPIEDEDNRTKPYVALFDPKTLAYTGEKHLLPVEKLPHGIPWLAVDARRGLFYTMDWDSRELQLYDLKTFSYRRSVVVRDAAAPDRLVGRVQGGKVHDGTLYLASDGADAKRLYAVDPASGLAREIASFKEPDRAEMEGLAFAPDGTLRVLMLAPYFYDARFPESLELNGDDWNPSARLITLRACR